jgi:hypothetical protein
MLSPDFTLKVRSIIQRVNLVPLPEWSSACSLGQQLTGKANEGYLPTINLD